MSLHVLMSFSSSTCLCKVEVLVTRKMRLFQMKGMILGYTPKNKPWKPKMMLLKDEFPFSIGVIFRFRPLVFRGCISHPLTLTWPMAKRLKLFGITYLVGKISRSNFFFQGPGRLSEHISFLWGLGFEGTPRPLTAVGKISTRIFDMISRWWFHFFFIFIPTWGRFQF